MNGLAERERDLHFVPEILKTPLCLLWELPIITKGCGNTLDYPIRTQLSQGYLVGVVYAWIWPIRKQEMLLIKLWSNHNAQVISLYQGGVEPTIGVKNNWKITKWQYININGCVKAKKPKENYW